MRVNLKHDYIRIGHTCTLFMKIRDFAKQNKTKKNKIQVNRAARLVIAFPTGAKSRETLGHLLIRNYIVDRASARASTLIYYY